MYLMFMYQLNSANNYVDVMRIADSLCLVYIEYYWYSSCFIISDIACGNAADVAPMWVVLM